MDDLNPNAKTMFTYGGGSKGDVWQLDQRQNPATGKIETFNRLRDEFVAVGPQGGSGIGWLNGRPEPGSPMEGKKPITVIPAGLSNKQEYAWMKKGAEARGEDWVEAPAKWEKKDDGKFYNTQTGQKFTGTILGRGSYGGFGGGNARPNTTQRSWSNYEGEFPIERNVGTDFYRESQAYGPRGTGMPTPPPAPTGGGAPRGIPIGEKNEAENLARWERSPRWQSGAGPTDLASREERAAWEARNAARATPAPQPQTSAPQTMMPPASGRFQGGGLEYTPAGEMMNQPTTSGIRGGLGGVQKFGGIPKYPFAGQY